MIILIVLIWLYGHGLIDFGEVMSVSQQSVEGICVRYTSSLLELAIERKSLDVVASDMELLGEALSMSSDLRNVVVHPGYDKVQLGRAMGDICSGLGVGDLVWKFVQVLVYKRRLFMLGSLIESFMRALALHRGEVRAHIRTAMDLSPSERDELLGVLRGTVSKDIVADIETDSSLLGGFVVRIGSRMIDSSLTTQLASLAATMKG